MTKENQRITLSKRLLKESLLNLLEKRHIDHISISELCQQAEINRTTFYRHYQTPHDILLEIEYDFIQSFYKSPIIEKNTGDLKKRTLYMCNFLYDNKDMLKLFIQNYTDSDLTFLFQKFFAEYMSHRTILYNGQQIDESTLHLLTTFWIYGIHGLTSQWILEDIPKTTEEMAELILSLFQGDFSFQ